jgi:hypothetical protein
LKSFDFRGLPIYREIEECLSGIAERKPGSKAIKAPFQNPKEHSNNLKDLG